jgi:hypothetical protein
MMRRVILALALALLPVTAAAQASSSLYGNSSAYVPTQYAVPTAGSTTVMAAGMGVLVLDNASLLATATVTLPASPGDGMMVSIGSVGGVTLLTVNGGTIRGAITALPTNGYVTYVFSTSGGAWVRMG